MRNAAAATSPGGPLVSSAKKRRLAALQESHGAARAPGPASKPAARGPAETPATAGVKRKQPYPADAPEAPASQQLVQPGVFPYTTLDPGSFDAMVARQLQHIHCRCQAGASASLEGVPGAGIDAMLAKLMGHSGRSTSETSAQSAISSRLRDRNLLLDNPSVRRSAGTPKSREVPVLHSSKLVTGRQRARINHVEPQSVRYLTFEPLHALWCDYVSHQLTLDPSGGAVGESRALLSCDLHGASLSVTRSRDPRLVGAAGIVCRVTTKTLHVVGRDDVLRVVPLDGCVFEVHLPGGRRASLVGHNYVRYVAKRPPVSIALARSGG